MKRTIMFFCLTFAVLSNRYVFGQAATLPSPFGPHQWTATVKVIGDDSNPIAGADVSIAYDIPTAPDSGQPTFDEVKGITDDSGLFNASHTDSSPGLGIVITKAGYYPTHIGLQFYYDEKRRNPFFTAVLKKIGKPIPMYAKEVMSEPNIFKKTGPPPIAFTNSAGYDLMTGDWVAPYGKGISTDIIFTEEFNKSTDDIYYKLTVSFPNRGDGIQKFDAPLLLQNAPHGQSDLRSAQNAPIDGYQPELVETTYDPNQNFYFRVRTKLDENGNVVSAHYGKIYGDFMQFAYYFNPTPNDLNVEFDTKENLLGGLQSFEQVRQP